MGEAGALAGTVEDELGYAEQVTTDAATGLVDDSSRTGLQTTGPRSAPQGPTVAQPELSSADINLDAQPRVRNPDVSGEFDLEGYNREGYNREGFNKDGIHQDTGTKFDKDGFDEDGFDEDGFDRGGFDKDGIHKDTGTKFDEDGFDEGTT